MRSSPVPRLFWQPRLAFCSSGSVLHRGTIGSCRGCGFLILSYVHRNGMGCTPAPFLCHPGKSSNIEKSPDHTIYSLAYTLGQAFIAMVKSHDHAALG